MFNIKHVLKARGIDIYQARKILRKNTIELDYGFKCMIQYFWPLLLTKSQDILATTATISDCSLLNLSLESPPTVWKSMEYSFKWSLKDIKQQ